MEVHHHPQLHHERKPWKEYLLEGLMIFLAVFMGFIAENIRESVVERGKEKEYLKEMVANLKFDTTRCHNNSALNEARMQGIDSLKAELQNAMAGKIDGNKLYYFTIKYAAGYNPAFFSSSALTELRSSGSLRILANKELVLKIVDYYDRTIYNALSARPDQRMEEMNKTRNEFFSWEGLNGVIDAEGKIDTAYNNNFNYDTILHTKPALLLLKTKPEDLQRLYNAVSEFEFNLKKYDAYLTIVKRRAIPLIDAIDKEYHFDKE
jgi:hypothetical protein